MGGRMEVIPQEENEESGSFHTSFHPWTKTSWTVVMMSPYLFHEVEAQIMSFMKILSLPSFSKCAIFAYSHLVSSTPDWDLVAQYFKTPSCAWLRYWALLLPESPKSRFYSDIKSFQQTRRFYGRKVCWRAPLNMLGCFYILLFSRWHFLDFMGFFLFVCNAHFLFIYLVFLISEA